MRYKIILSDDLRNNPGPDGAPGPKFPPTPADHQVFSKVGKKTAALLRFSTVAGERGAADAARDVRGFALRFHAEEGNRDLVGNNTLVFFVRDPLNSPDEDR